MSPANERFYRIPDSPSLAHLLATIDARKAEIEAARPLSGDLWDIIQQKLRIDWTYHSNAIEGSTLSREDTHFFLTEGLTVEGKPLNDFLDARNHANAIDVLHEVVAEEHPITTSLITSLNALLLSGVKNQFDRPGHTRTTPGVYKQQPNHVLQADGTIHAYVDPIQVPADMNQLVRWIETSMGTVHPVIVAALAHYNMVRIHPFDDGNGRGARILMNLVLLRLGYPPAIIRMEERRRYLDALDAADRGNDGPFALIVAEALLRTENVIVDDLGATPSSDV